VNAVDAEQKAVREGVTGLDRLVYGPYLLQLSPAYCASIVMHETLNALLVTSTFSVPVVPLAVHIGKCINTEVGTSWHGCCWCVCSRSDTDMELACGLCRWRVGINQCAQSTEGKMDRSVENDTKRSVLHWFG